MKENNNIIIPELLAINKPDSNLLKKINGKIFKDKILYKTKSSFHNIKVIENEIGRFLHYKNTYQAGFINTDYYRGNLPYINYFFIPYLINKNIKKILLIGLGTGKLVNDFEKLFADLKFIDIVDIEENSLDIAEKFFNFKNSDKYSFYLQDARIFLRENKKKYDLIVVDVANNDGIDSRFLELSYIQEIKKSLTKNGIFVSNLCSSPDFDNKKNKFFKSVTQLYKNNFKHIQIYKGNTSDTIYYKSFFDIDKRVIDITNVIFISSDKYSYDDINIKYVNKINELDIDINKYISDFCKNHSL